MRAVIFDLDGVLLDTTQNMRCSFAAVWHAAGRSGQPPFDEFLAQMGAPLATILGSFELPASYAAVYAAASTVRQDLIAPYDGIVELLRELRRSRVPTGIATGKARARALEALSTGGLDGMVDVVVGSDEVSSPKPHPEILHTGLARLPGPRPVPRDAVFVGDSVLDMRCGRAAGMTTIAAGWGQGTRAALLAERPDGFAPRPPDLAGALLGREVSVG